MILFARKCRHTTKMSLIVAMKVTVTSMMTKKKKKTRLMTQMKMEFLDESTKFVPIQMGSSCPHLGVRDEMPIL